MYRPFLERKYKWFFCAWNNPLYNSRVQYFTKIIAWQTVADGVKVMNSQGIYCLRLAANYLIQFPHWQWENICLIFDLFIVVIY